MTIEEKAKAYDKALEIARQYYNDKAMPIGTNFKLEKMFPVLTESEDERIKKKVIGVLKLNIAGAESQMQASRGVDRTFEIYACNKVIAWLEKQGESDETKAKIFLINKGYPIDANGTFPTYEEIYNIIREGLEEQGEQKSFARYKVGDTIYYDSFGRLVSFVIANIVEDGTNNPMYEDKDGNSVFQNDIVEQKSIDKVEPKFKKE